MCDSSDDEEIPLSILQLFKDLFSCEYENLPRIDSQIHTCQPSDIYIYIYKLYRCTNLYKVSVCMYKNK